MSFFFFNCEHVLPGYWSGVLRNVGQQPEFLQFTSIDTLTIFYHIAYMILKYISLTGWLVPILTPKTKFFNTWRSRYSCEISKDVSGAKAKGSALGYLIDWSNGYILLDTRPTLSVYNWRSNNVHTDSVPTLVRS